MTFQQALQHAGTKLLAIRDDANIRLDAQLLLCHACNIEQTQIISHPEHSLTATQLEIFQAIVNRRAKGEPLAYITGSKEFWSLDFIVNQDVLIPRPETELLVECALTAIKDENNPHILDLGTGSGAIAISIKKELNTCDMLATDISPTALEIAKQNASRHEVNISFLQSDWYEKLTNDKFDLIVCNPPYIAASDPNLEKQVADHEPTKALISSNDGLADLEKVICHANKYLTETGRLIVEHGFQQADQVQQLFKQYGFKSVHTLKDLAGLDRVTLAIY